MSDASTTIVGSHCPQCGAKQVRAENDCWLCRAKTSTKSPHINKPCPTTAEPERFSFSMGTVMLLMTLASIVFGILASEPGLGIFVCVLLAPVLVRTVLVVRAREAAGKQVPAVEKVGLLLVSFGVASIVSVTVIVAAFASFCGVCFLTLSATDNFGGSSEVFVWAISMCAAALAAILCVVRMSKWIRERYRRDIGEE